MQDISNIVRMNANIDNDNNVFNNYLNDNDNG